MEQDFHDQLVALLPRLRAQARALVRNRTAAEDLVHDTVCNALAAQKSFAPGTNMAAWMHRILRNRFISNLRKARESQMVDESHLAQIAIQAPHEDQVAVRELDVAMGRLPAEQREALMMVVFDNLSYEELAEITGVAVGTAKSRVFRARRHLQAWLLGEPEVAVPALKQMPKLRRILAEERSEI